MCVLLLVAFFTEILEIKGRATTPNPQHSQQSSINTITVIQDEKQNTVYRQIIFSATKTEWILEGTTDMEK